MLRINVQEIFSSSEESKNSNAKSQPFADITKQDEAILEAVELGHFKDVKALTANSPNLRITNEQGWSLLHIAAYRGHEPIVQWLLKRGLNPTLTTPIQWTPLHCAAYKGHKAVAKLLLSYNAPLEAADDDGWTPLHCATFKEHKSLIKLLLKQGARPEAKNKAGLTPGELAIQHSKFEIADFIASEYKLLSTSLKKQLVRQAAEINSLKEIVFHQQQTLNRQGIALKRLMKSQKNDRRKIDWLEQRLMLQETYEQDAKRAKNLDRMACNPEQVVQSTEQATTARQLVDLGIFQKPSANNQNTRDEETQTINSIANTQ